jgi:hypothetical protein
VITTTEDKMSQLDDIIDTIIDKVNRLRCHDPSGTEQELHDTLNEILGCTPDQYTDLRNHDHLRIVVDLRKFMRLSTVKVSQVNGVNADGEPHAKQRDLSEAKSWADVAGILDDAERSKNLKRRNDRVKEAVLQKREQDARLRQIQSEEDAQKARDIEEAFQVNTEKTNQWVLG